MQNVLRWNWDVCIHFRWFYNGSTTIKSSINIDKVIDVDFIIFMGGSRDGHLRSIMVFRDDKNFLKSKFTHALKHAYTRSQRIFENSLHFWSESLTKLHYSVNRHINRYQKWMIRFSDLPFSTLMKNVYSLCPFSVTNF